MKPTREGVGWVGEGAPHLRPPSHPLCGAGGLPRATPPPRGNKSLGDTGVTRPDPGGSPKSAGGRAGGQEAEEAGEGGEGGAGSPKPWEHCGNRWRRKTAWGEPCRGEAAELETATAGGEMKRGRERRAHLSPAAAAAAVPGRQSCLQHRECKHSLPGTARCPQLPEPWPGVREGHKPRFWLNFNFFPHHRGGRTPRGGS